jgi:molybdopterin molybdotransferase
MISVAEATRIVLENTHPALIEEVPLLAAQGRILREPIRADRDFPPFHRVTMDGIALRFDDFRQGNQAFEVAGVQHAGSLQQSLKEASQCLEVMTGTVLPEGADTVIRYEDLDFSERDGRRYAHVKLQPESSGLNVHRQGSDRQAGDLLISPGTKIGPSHIGVAASVGKATLRVSQPLRMAVISTGDELVDIGQEPLPHQIRRSNAYALAAAFGRVGAQTELFHLRDEPDLLRKELATLLQSFDCLVLSGGVSMGKADFVPGALAQLGVEKRFHTVAQRPGKPFWFGRSPEGKAVFALPGNPVSTFMCAHRYVLPWLKTCLQEKEAPIPTAVLAEPVVFKPPLAYFLQVQTYQDPDGRLMARPHPGGGSGDLANLLDANAFLELPAEKSEFAAGERFQIWEF